MLLFSAAIFLLLLSGSHHKSHTREYIQNVPNLLGGVFTSYNAVITEKNNSYSQVPHLHWRTLYCIRIYIPPGLFCQVRETGSAMLLNIKSDILHLHKSTIVRI